MNTTINISLPKSILTDARKHMVSRGYATLSEFIRSVLRNELYPRLTENGFTPEFETEVLKAAAEPRSKDKTWETEEDITNYFNNLVRRIRKKHGKDHSAR
jgi:Arc/MetJ-type ribon-helix-helix transcriptional regulator